MLHVLPFLVTLARQEIPFSLENGKLIFLCVQGAVELFILLAQSKVLVLRYCQLSLQLLYPGPLVSQIL